MKSNKILLCFEFIFAVLSYNNYILGVSCQPSKRVDVNVERVGRQEDARTEALNNGGFVIVWEDDITVDGEDVFLAIFDSNANKVAGDTLVNNQVQNRNQQDPDVAVLNNGNIVVVWRSDEGDGSLQIYARLFNQNGVGISNELLVSGDRQRNVKPRVSKLDNDGFVVAWDIQNENNNNVNQNVHARVYDSDGGSTISEFRVNPDNGRVALEVTVTGLTSDISTFIVTYVSTVQVNVQGEIRAQKLLGDGNVKTEIGDEFVVSDDPANAGTDRRRPAIDRLGDGFIVVWESNDLGVDDVFGHRFNNAGFTLEGNELLINAVTDFDERQPDVFELGNAGAFVVVFERQINGFRSLFLQEFSAQANRVGGEILLSNPNVDSNDVSGVALSNGDFVTVWELGDNADLDVVLGFFDNQENEEDEDDLGLIIGATVASIVAVGFLGYAFVIVRKRRGIASTRRAQLESKYGGSSFDSSFQADNYKINYGGFPSPGGRAPTMGPPGGAVAAGSNYVGAPPPRRNNFGVVDRNRVSGFFGNAMSRFSTSFRPYTLFRASRVRYEN